MTSLTDQVRNIARSAPMEKGTRNRLHAIAHDIDMEFEALCNAAQYRTARLAEYEEAHRITVNDCGAPDEQHCSCVPSLRLEAKRLQARLDEAERDAARYRWLRHVSAEQVRVFGHYAGPALDGVIDAARATDSATPREDA